jgi:F-type H+-transporting ATPase subunit b
MRISWWTLALQTANFLVLVWLLQRFLYKPVRAILEARRGEVERAMANAAAAQQAAEALRRDLEAQRGSIDRERERAIEVAHAQAKNERAALLEKAQRERDEAAAHARVGIEREREDAAKAIQDRSAALAVEIASRLLATVGPQPSALLFERALEGLRSLTPDQRQALAPAGGNGVRIVTAWPLDDNGRHRCREELAALLGRATEVGFAEDPRLIAGVEIHFPNTILRHSWREALSGALEEMTRDADAHRGA